MSEPLTLTAGQTMTSGAIHFSEAEIIDFAKQFDPQPYHLDARAAEASIFGGLCASGWQVAAFTSRLVNEALQQAGIPVIDVNRVASMRWKRPLFVDENIHVLVTIEEIRAHATQPDWQTLALNVCVNNAHEQLVAELQCDVIIQREVTP